MEWGPVCGINTGIIVSGSIMNTWKPLNSTGSCFQVIPRTCAALKTDLVCGNIWHSSEKMPFVFFWPLLFNVYCIIFPRWFLWSCRHWSFSLFRYIKLLTFQNSQQLPSVTYFLCVFVSKIWSFRTKLLESIRITNYFK